jgi:hypothetical protein
VLYFLHKPGDSAVKILNLLLLSIIAAGVLGAPALADEKTLLGDMSEIDHGGFGGPVVKFTQVDGAFAVLSGGRGGWIIDHRFVLGGGGYGMVTRHKAKGLVDTSGESISGQDLEMGYGGGILEVIIASDQLIHFSTELLIGAGGVTTSEGSEDDAFFVAEPGVNLMLNITKFFRMGFGASYRFTAGAKFGEIDSGDLSGGTAVLTFKFGSF